MLELYMIVSHSEIKKKRREREREKGGRGKEGTVLLGQGRGRIG